MRRVSIIKVLSAWGLDFWDLHDDMQYQAEFLVKKKEDGSTYPYVINSSVIVDTGELYRDAYTTKWRVKQPTIEMKLIIFDTEESKNNYLEQIKRGEKARYEK